MEFFTIFLEHNNANIDNFISSVPIQIKKTNTICNFER